MANPDHYGDWGSPSLSKPEPDFSAESTDQKSLELVDHILQDHRVARDLLARIHAKLLEMSEEPLYIHDDRLTEIIRELDHFRGICAPIESTEPKITIGIDSGTIRVDNSTGTKIDSDSVKAALKAAQEVINAEPYTIYHSVRVRKPSHKTTIKKWNDDKLEATRKAPLEAPFQRR